MNPARIAIPANVSSVAHTASGDIARVTSTLTGTTTHAALVSAEQARKRAIVALRDLGPVIRRMAKEIA